MNCPKLLQKNILASLLALGAQWSIAQVLVQGTVYDRTGRYPLPGVSVLASSGAGTMTDSLGQYHLRLNVRDSVYLSWLGRPGLKYPVKEIKADGTLDLNLPTTFDSLASVSVRSSNYLSDSTRNREEYKKAFDYQANLMNGVKARERGMGVGLDMDMLVDGKASKRAITLQERLEQNEQDNYIDSRFTKSLVHKLTGLEPPRLDSFMKIYRPSAEFLHSFSTDYEFYKYISDTGKLYLANQ